MNEFSQRLAAWCEAPACRAGQSPDFTLGCAPASGSAPPISREKIDSAVGQRPNQGQALMPEYEHAARQAGASHRAARQRVSREANPAGSPYETDRVKKNAIKNLL
jgi:hypothetical protein